MPDEIELIQLLSSPRADTSELPDGNGSCISMAPPLNLIRLSDNGPEFVSRAVCQWLEESGCQSLFINPSSPWENGYIESFLAKLRNECLNREVFRNGWEAQAIVENWRQEDNNYRPHSSLGYLTPAEFAKRYCENNQAEEAAQPVEKVGSLSLLGGTQIGGTLALLREVQGLSESKFNKHWELGFTLTHSAI